jgi:hypothetical protein
MTTETGHDTAEATPSWQELGAGLGSALGGLLLALQAMVVIPGLFAGVAVGALLFLPLVALAAAAALVIGVPLGVVRLAARVLRR